MPKPTLQYFDLEGRAEAIRYTCYLAKIDYDDCRLSREEFASKKAAGEFPLGSVPVWTEDGEKFCGSNNILRMIGMRNGMYDCNDAKLAWMIDSSMECIEDNMGKYSAYYFKFMSQQVPTQEDIEKQCQFWETVCACIERRLSMHGKKFVAGTDSPTVADCKMIVNFIHTFMNDKNPMPAEVKKQMRDIVEKFPCTKKWCMETMWNCLKGYMMNKMTIEVHFLKFHGRADPIIQMLAHAKVNRKKVIYEKEEWAAKKAAGEAGEFGGMPMIVAGPHKFDLSIPALRRLAIVFGYYPKDDWKAAMMCDQVVDAQGDAFNAIAIPILSGGDEMKAKILACFEENGAVTKYFNFVTKILECSKGPFICGAKISMADCAMASFIFNHFKNSAGNPEVTALIGPILAEKFPKIEEYSKCLEKEFGAHLATREANNL